MSFGSESDPSTALPQVVRALSWLRPDPKLESRRYAAVVVLRQLAEAAPTVFNVFVTPFVDCIWTALRDARLPVREAARDALRECLCVVEARETRYRMQWYYQLYETSLGGLKPPPAAAGPPPHRQRDGGADAAGGAVRPEVIHASLLVFGELLRHTGEFMLARYREVADTILRYKDHKDRVIRWEVIRLMPRIAAFAPARFARSYLPQGAAHVLAAASRPGDKAPAFAALSSLAEALAEEDVCVGGQQVTVLAPFLADVASSLGDALTAPPRRREALPEALLCAGAMAQHCGRLWAPYARALLPALLAAGLTQPMVDALASTAKALPELMPLIQDRLLAALAAALARRPEDEVAPRSGGAHEASATPGATSSQGAGTQAAGSGAAGAGSRREEVCLALHTLARFNFKGRPLMSLVRDVVAPHLEDGDPECRRAAAASAATLLRHRGSSAPSPPHTSQVLSRLLSCAVVDADFSVRAAVLHALMAPSSVLDAHLSQAVALKTLFLALNDESATCRGAAARVVGRLAARNAAYVLPALRKHLLQLLLDLEHGMDSALREEAATLLGVLAMSCPTVVLPYVPPLMRALMAKLGEEVPHGGSAAKTHHHHHGAHSHGGPGVGAPGGLHSTSLAPASVGGGSLGGAAQPAPAPGPGAAVVAGNTLGAATAAAPGAAGGVTSAAGGPGMQVAGGFVMGGRAPPAYGERRAVMETIGCLASVGGAACAPFLPDILPLINDALRDAGGAGAGGVRDAAVVTLGKLAVCVVGSPAAHRSSGGGIPSPLDMHPALLDVLLSLLGEATSGADLRRHVLSTLGALGALDPQVHKEQRARAAGEGVLSAEGVRGTRQLDGPPTTAGPGGVLKPAAAGAPGPGGAPGPDGEDGGGAAGAGGGAAGDDGSAGGEGGNGRGGNDLFPVTGLTTASDEFYPTIAMNALFRVLRDPQQSSQHGVVVRALRYLLDALGMGVVPYLPRILPALVAAARATVTSQDEQLRELLVDTLSAVTACVRGHVRPFLHDLLPLCYALWDATAAAGAVTSSGDAGAAGLGHAGAVAGSGAGSGSGFLPLLRMVEVIAAALQDEFRPHLDDVLPRFVALLTDAERTRRFESTPHVLHTLECCGLCLEEHLRIVLPALMRLIKPGCPTPMASLANGAATGAHSDGVVGRPHANGGSAQPTDHFGAGLKGSGANTLAAPVSVRRAVLRTLARMLSRLPLEAHVSAIVHPLLRALDAAAHNPGDAELRHPTADALAAVASALGPDFRVFIPATQKAFRAARVSQPRFDAVVAALDSQQPWIPPPPQGPPPVSPLPLPSTSTSGGGGGGSGASPGGVSGSPSDSRQLALEESALRRAWESSHRSTKEDWFEWLRHLAVEQLRNSPSPALRACLDLASVQPAMARELFAAAFASCWSDLGETAHESLSASLESALGGATTPPAIVATLLNLAEFMEHDEHPLPLDARTLGAHAARCRAFAKALRYKEQEFSSDPAGCVEALISINNALGQPDAAAGSLVYAQTKLKLAIKEEWYEALGRWEAALESYLKRATLAGAGSEARHAAQLGRMRCLAALAEWQHLGDVAATEWEGQPQAHLELAPVAAQAAWHLGDWDSLERYVAPLPSGVAASGEDGHSAGGMHDHSLTMASVTAGSSAAAAAHLLVGASAGQRADATADWVQLTTDGDLYRAVLAMRKGDLALSRRHVEAARELLATELAALVGESYERAYSGLVRVQQLTELEEVIALYEARAAHASTPGAGPDGGGFGGASGSETDTSLAEVSAAASPASHLLALRAVWRRRIGCVRRSADVWQALLSVRRLVFPPEGVDVEDAPVWAQFAALQRKAGAPRAARRTLLRMLGVDPSTAPPGVAALPGSGSGGRHPEVVLAFLKHLWATGHRGDALHRLAEVVDELRGPAAAAAAAVQGGDASVAASAPQMATPPMGLSSATATRTMHTSAQKLTPMSVQQLYARSSLRVAQWRWVSAGVQLDEGTITSVLTSLRAATDADPGWSKAWHLWGLFNAAAMEHYARTSPGAAARHVAPAVRGFFRSIALGTTKGGTHLQDILRLLTLWFAHGAAPEVEAALQEGFGQVSIDTWLAVIPQIVARIHSSIPPVRQLIHSLLVRVGRHHPQALLYPVLVASKSQSPARRAAANAVLDALRGSAGTLVAQAQLVSEELIRVAITWHEQWHEALEEASRLYFGEANVDAMLAVLAPLHAPLERGDAETLQEGAFVAAYGRELGEAAEWCARYRSTGREADLNNAWDLYYHVFKRINKQLPTMTQLELQHVSPRLLSARHLELAVPGNYIVGAPLVTISSFSPTLHVITSKQRPRKLSVHGSDGKVYGYLLKGHEDLRQDERVMQLFGLVNTLLAQDGRTAGRDLDIARYAVVPLSPNSGLIGWVPNCDTLHALIREHREAHKVPLNMEHRIMLAMAPDYDQLPLINKVEVFEHALANTAGDDIARVLWLRSRSSEVWLDRRTAYTRSLAVMSMVGYLLGLGDRHPSNLMLDRYSGKILHIDFGDCFEASQHRDKFPEKVPFRLTRMLVNAMEACGIEGNFRHTAEIVMAVLRNNKDSVMAMLEAFVHDPLINWRLLQAADAGALTAQAQQQQQQQQQPTPPTTPQPTSGGPGASEVLPPPSGEAPVMVTPPPQQPPAAPGPPPLPPSGKRPGPAVRRSSMNAAALMEQQQQQQQQPAPGAPPEAGPPGGRPLVARRGSFNAAALEEEARVGAAAAAAQLSTSRATRVLGGAVASSDGGASEEQAAPPAPPPAALPAPGVASPPLQRAARERELKDVFFALGDANEVLNERAVSVMRRMAAKLTGRDGGAVTGVPGAPASAAAAAAAAVADGPADSVEAQVQRLISEAMSHENLCQSYIGWCGFW